MDAVGFQGFPTFVAQALKMLNAILGFKVEVFFLRSIPAAGIMV
jgi:hypothetical protein